MKTFKAVLVLFLVSIVANAQDLTIAEVPSNIKTQFNKEFKNARDIEWENDFDKFKVEFEVDRMDYEVWYSTDAKQVKLEKEISKLDLPTAVSKAIQAKFSEYHIDDCELQEVNNTVTYFVELEKWNYEIDVVYSAKGKLIRTTH
ncbi:PepSY-like domain-containing protein [Mesonia sp.]|uniref:PepSY-like domain-containing protein n=1 Tax=Mesonia sp. TaxID=1960830 RepID=UPI00176F6DDA|nr:PepSY-like domain-containing protein [Mesonia sp.]HIB36718.1 hypothetical protein [Mesonia sp.]HIO27583.1 hypothetical protein [Flavobacteriaceae bacterium]